MTDDINPMLHLDPHARVLAAASIAAGVAASVERRAGGAYWLQLSIGRNRYLYRYGVLCRALMEGGVLRLQEINGDGAEIMSSKTGTIEFLSAAGISAPAGRTFTPSDLAEAFDYAMALGPPVCVKPLRGAMGISVFPNLTSAAWIQKALVSLVEAKVPFRIEKHVGLQEIRYFYTKPYLVGLLIAELLVVIGDGVSTVRELGDAVSAERRSRSQSSHGPIDWDEDRLQLLAAQGLSIDIAPPAGSRIQLSRTANRNRGGVGFDGRGRVHPSYARVAKMAFDAIPGLKIAALDMRLHSRDVEATPDNHWVLEINSAPGLTGYHSLWDGSQDIAGAMVRWLIADASATR